MGYVCEIKGETFLFNPSNSLEMLIYNRISRSVTKFEKIFRCMSASGTKIYYINPEDHNYVYVYDTLLKSDQLIVKKSARQIQVDENLLYILDSVGLYTYEILLEKLVTIDKQEIRKFQFIDNGLVYITKDSLVKLVNNRIIFQMPMDVVEFFCTKDHIYVLKKNDLSTFYKVNDDQTLESISVYMSNLVQDEMYSYITEGNDNESIYRTDHLLEQGIRIFGKNAKGLRLIDDRLYFWSNEGWHVMNTNTFEITDIKLEV